MRVLSEHTRLACAVAGLSSALACGAGAAQEVSVYAAGSLRGVVNDTAQAVQEKFHITVHGTFGSSGSLRERIEKGESPELFLSADLASPAKLEEAGRTVAPVAVFARNRMCIVSERAAGLTAGNMVERMLAKAVRIKTSTPIADPSGDYAWAIFERIDAQHPGAGAKLKEKAQASMQVTAAAAPPGQHPYAALFAARQIDIAITYCSGVPAMVQAVPQLRSFVVPPQFDPHPIDGMAILSGKPEVLRVAMFLYSEAGQAIIARQGLVPLAQGADAPR